MLGFPFAQLRLEEAHTPGRELSMKLPRMNRVACTFKSSSQLRKWKGLPLT